MDSGLGKKKPGSRNNQCSCIDPCSELTSGFCSKIPLGTMNDKINTKKTKLIWINTMKYHEIPIHGHSLWINNTMKYHFSAKTRSISGRRLHLCTKGRQSEPDRMLKPHSERCFRMVPKRHTNVLKFFFGIKKYVCTIGSH